MTMRIALIAPSLSVADASQNNADHLFKLCGGNTGNFAFVFALYQLLSPYADVLSWEVNPETVKHRYDVIVFACANQLGPHTDLGWLADRLSAMDRPILAVGLGAQTLDTSRPVELTAGTRRWLDVIAGSAPSSAPNIGVRGLYTQSQLHILGHAARAAVIGCPSNLINTNPALGQSIDRRYASEVIERVAVPAGLHLWPSLQRIEEWLADLVESCSGAYVAQSEIDMIRLARDESDAISPDVLEQLRAYIRPTLNTADFVRWMRRHATTFIDAASWMDAMRKFDFVVGPRFHGVMMGIQAGVPGAVIAHDSRTFELCQTIGIPVLDHKDIHQKFGLSDLRSMFPFDGAAYDQKRAALAQTLYNMFTHAGIVTSLAPLEGIVQKKATAA
jgi:Polysaccharide pyruvyl transferase